MYKQILVPIDLGSPELNKPAMETALMMAGQSEGTLRLVTVLPLTPVMLAEYVPPDFEMQQRKTTEDALAIIVKEAGIEPSRISSTVRQGGIYQEILEEANEIKADLIVMTSHRPQRHAVRTYFIGLRKKLLAEGPPKLTHREKMALLLDADSMIWLHEQLWKEPAVQLAEWWRLAMRQYNVLTATPVTALYR